MINCSKEKLVVETEKGTYIHPADKAAGQCAAEEKCTLLGAILAPFTEKSEFDAVVNAINSCDYHRFDFNSKYIGLNIAKDNSSRVFSNGVEFSYKLHGHLYDEKKLSTTGLNCPGAFLSTAYTDKLKIYPKWKCKQNISKKYICFKPKKSSRSDEIIGDAVTSNSSFVIVGTSCFVALICLVVFLLIKVKKQASKISQLTSSVA